MEQAEYGVESVSIALGTVCIYTLNMVHVRYRYHAYSIRSVCINYLILCMYCLYMIGGRRTSMYCMNSEQYEVYPWYILRTYEQRFEQMIYDTVHNCTAGAPRSIVRVRVRVVSKYGYYE